MKKFSVILLALICVLAVLPLSAVSKNGSFGDVPLYKGTITIDGKKDAIYSKGLVIPVNVASDTAKSESSGTVYLLHDGANLYVLFEAKSAYALTDYNSSLVNSKSYSTTAAELNLDWTNAATSNAACKKYICWYDGQYWAFRDNNKTTDVEYKATVDKAAKTFVMEWKCPFRDQAATGKEIGFNFMFDSDKTMGPSSNATRTVVYTVAKVENDGSTFKNIKFSAKEVFADTTAAATTKAAATAAATPKTTIAAAKTADASVVVALVATIALAGVVVCKKKH